MSLLFRLEYIPVSFQDLPITQYLAVLTEGRAHPFIPLSCEDGDDVFGLDQSFEDGVPRLPQIDNDEIRSISFSLIEDAFAHDPPMTLEQILGDVSNTVTQDDCTVEFSVTAMESDLANEQSDHETSDPDTEHNTRKRRRKLASLQGHTTGRRSAWGCGV